MYFQSIADGYYSEDDLVDVVTYASKYMQPGWDSLRDTTFKYAVDFDTVSPLLREIDRLPSTPALTSKFTVILPFFLSGQRRIQTVLINEYISAIEATDADKVFNLWMVYLGE
ncbi:MAG TPA: hypothetical protein VI603_12900 [Saprospiraceae bacterium]|nr:hypothetical protein [Saprospiraceae bacterium]